MKLLKSLYYYLFCIWLNKRDEQGNAHINAVITLTFLLYINLISIPLVLMAVYKNEIIDLPEISGSIKVLIIGALIAVGTFNYFLFAHKKNHERIIEEFREIPNSRRKKGIVTTVVYLIVSLGIPLYVFFFTSPI